MSWFPAIGTVLCVLLTYVVGMQEDIGTWSGTVTEQYIRAAAESIAMIVMVSEEVTGM